MNESTVEDMAPDFDLLAGIYRWMEWFSFGPWLSKCRLAFLDNMAGRRNALIIGDGDGRFTGRLVQSDPQVQVDAVDASPAMLRALTRRTDGARARVRTHLADARQWRPEPDRRYDLVATHFFLDCLTTSDVERLAAAVRPALTTGAVWIVSEFAVPKSVFGRLDARPLVSGLYQAFGILTGLRVRRLPDYRAALNGAGLKLIESRTFLHGLLVSELWVVN
jgi:ubiquinone/menaquinone biosynthesis C-methylase UbiE